MGGPEAQKAGQRSTPGQERCLSPAVYRDQGQPLALPEFLADVCIPPWESGLHTGEVEGIWAGNFLLPRRR